MRMDITSEIFGGEEKQPEAETPKVETVETPAPEVEAPPAPEPAPEPTPEPEAPKEDKSVPLTALLDERDRRKEAERRAAEYESRQAASAPVDMPDPIDDPRGFAEWQNSQVQQALVSQRFEMSDLMAKQQYGEETVKTAAEWAMEKAKADPLFATAYMQQPHPIDWIVREHKRSALVNDIGDNVDDWFAKEAEKRGYAPTAPNTAPAPAVAASPPAVKPAVPPRSIASDASAPKVQGDPSADFMAIFKR
jgi:hypothetical protein